MERPNRIRELREARRLSQRDLARRMGLTGPEVHKLETGMRRLRSEHLDKLTAILGEEAGVIAGWSPSAASPETQLDRIEAKLDELLSLLRTTENTTRAATALTAPPVVVGTQRRRA